jgi:hypothetical protein
MKDTNDKPIIATRIATIHEAVQLSLKDAWTKNCLFVFARLLRAFEVTIKTKLTPESRAGAFSLWWNTAIPMSWQPADADFDEYRLEFEHIFPKVRTPHGANPLQEAISRADINALPPQASRYPSPNLKRLVAVCYQLQLLQGNNPFFLSVRDAARILGTKDRNRANALLTGLVRDGILVIDQKGIPGGTLATRYKFNFSAGSEP